MCCKMHNLLSIALEYCDPKNLLYFGSDFKYKNFSLSYERFAPDGDNLFSTFEEIVSLRMNRG